MSNYIRVIPRDLFNEANLLKCLARLYLMLDKLADHRASYDVESVDSFDVRQNGDDGSISVANLPFSVSGQPCHLSRPLNSREPWPLYLANLDNPDCEPIAVFNDEGFLSVEMLAFIR